MKLSIASLALSLAHAAPILDTRQDSIIPGEFIAVLKPDLSSDGLLSVVQSVTGILGGSAPNRVFDFAGFKGLQLSAADGVLSLITDLAEVSLSSIL